MQRDTAFEAELTARLAAFDARQADVQGKRAAAVAVAVADAGFGADLAGLPQHQQWSRDAALLLTRRAASLKRHAGQWALPGGRVDPGESVEEAALRELSEEVGLTVGPEHIVGRLDDIVTRSGFVMTPIVVLAGTARDLTINAGEVASVHRIPVTELLREDAPMLNYTEDNTDPELKMPVGHSWIAAPTAAVLYQFREVCLMNRHTRVDRFGQPKFTWR